MNAKLTLKSSNAKVGPLPVSRSDRSTCPESCPLKDKGCYGRTGHMSSQWSRTDTDWQTFLSNVRALPTGQPWRHNVLGDLPGIGDKVDSKALAQLVRANGGKRGWTYTHKPVLNSKANAAAIAKANKDGFTVNLSANTAAEADKLASLGIAPTVVLLPEKEWSPVMHTPQGRKIVVCPTFTRQGVQCSSCQLCAKANRSVIVGFPAHGAEKKTVDLIAKGLA